MVSQKKRDGEEEEKEGYHLVVARFP